MAIAEIQAKHPQYSLESIAIFRGLPAETLERIQRRCRWRRYGPGESIIDYLDTSDEVFFMLAGSARVTIRSVDGKVVSFRELGPGDMFGEYAAIDGRSRSACVKAHNHCDCGWKVPFQATDRRHQKALGTAGTVPFPATS